MKKTNDTSEKPDEARLPNPSQPIDPELIEDVKKATSIMASHKDKFWKLKSIDSAIKKKKKFLGIFKKRNLNEDEYKELQKAVAQSPGNTRVKLKKLLKKHPDEGSLLMLSALATFGMVLNSSNKEIAFDGYKTATREAATALLWDQISLHNIEMFFKIYFAYLERFKRFQVAVYERMMKEPRMEDHKREFLNAIQIAEQLYSDKESIQKIINNLKQRMKSSMYHKNIEFRLIKDAAHHIVNGTKSEKNRMGTASETIAYVQAIASSFARIPVLSPVVDKLLSILPETNKIFLLRKISVNSTRNFVKYRMAAAEGEQEVMSKIGKTILKESTFGIAKQEGSSLNQPYETDPFFNLAYLADLSHGLYSDSEHQLIVDSAIEAMNTVIAHDMSKNHIFTEMATQLSHKLGVLRASSNSTEKVSQ